ncbi:Fc.00g049490.m01.CDS01 [Cosmosporella sp. VM-42]
MASSSDYGIILSNGSQIVHGSGAKVKDPFTHIPVTLNELSPGFANSRPAFRGQSGFIEFDTKNRLPRHVHISPNADGKGGQALVYERIFVVGGVALVELGGQIYVIPPLTLVTIAKGVPHTWTACPEGVNVSQITGLSSKEEVISDGKFLMWYEYEEITGFFPTAQSETLKSVEEKWKTAVGL